MLLDTHVLLWALADDPRLGAETRRLVLGGGEVLFSAASIWELVIKSMLGKITVPESLSDDLAESGLRELPVTAAHATAMRQFAELGGQDPFDRMLVAQARAEGVQLITADRAILGLGLPDVHDARR